MKRKLGNPQRQATRRLRKLAKEVGYRENGLNGPQAVERRKRQMARRAK